VRDCRTAADGRVDAGDVACCQKFRDAFDGLLVDRRRPRDPHGGSGCDLGGYRFYSGVRQAGKDDLGVVCYYDRRGAGSIASGRVSRTGRLMSGDNKRSAMEGPIWSRAKKPIEVGFVMLFSLSRLPVCGDPRFIGLHEALQEFAGPIVDELSAGVE
jgi:hypothetical protein